LSYTGSILILNLEAIQNGYTVIVCKKLTQQNLTIIVVAS